MDEQAERELFEILRNQAKMTRALYSELVEQGFSNSDALSLTHTWLRAVVSKPPEGRG